MNTCTICGHPIRKRNRTTHVSCAAQPPQASVQQQAPEGEPLSYRSCCFCRSTDTTFIEGAPFCEEHRPDSQRNSNTLTLAPERCPKCHEFLTPGVTKGSVKCKCDMPKMPRHLMNRENDDRPPMQGRYGN